MSNTTLTSQQQKFAIEYSKTLDATASAIKAGYSKRVAAYRASELLKNPEILNIVYKNIDSTFKTLNISKPFFIKQLLNLLFTAITIEPVFDRQNNPTGVSRMTDPAIAIRAIDALIKLDNNQSEATQDSRIGLNILNLDSTKI